MAVDQPYHETEIALQERTGRRSLAEALAPRIWPEIVSEVIDFLPTLPFAVVGSLDDAGRPWTSILAGEPGFLAPTKTALRISTAPLPTDPLSSNLDRGGDLAVIGIDFAKRRRFRINGWATSDDSGILLNVAQCYRNCPQYIHAREAIFVQRASSVPVSARRMERLDEEAVRIVSRADTFFIATHGAGRPDADPRLGADVSHRGGNPGFVAIEENRLSFPDYIGNFMFNTLGNLTRYPRCGMLFVDFDSGTTLQITGKANVDWQLARATAVPGAQRMIDVEIEEAVLTEAALPLGWHLIEAARDLRRYRVPDATPVVHAGNLPEISSRPSREGFTRVIVSKIVDDADRIRSFYLRPKEGHLLPYLAGQFVRVEIPLHAAPPLVRRYSLSNYHPSPKEYRITVRRSDTDTSISGSNWLHDSVREGSELDIGPPEGVFTLAPGNDRPIALVSVGSGVTPVLAMLHSLALSATDNSIWFVHGARNGAEQAYAAEIRRLSDRLPNLTAHFRYSRPRDVDFMGRDHDSVGRVDAALLGDLVPDDADFYLCGPMDFMRDLKAELIMRGIPRDRIRVESFGAGLSAEAGETGFIGAKVHFADSNADAIWQDGSDNLLALAESIGLAPIHSCRTGSCGSCQHTLLDGRVYYPNAPLFDVTPGNVLLCCSKPMSDLTIGKPSDDSDA
jgi:ferredoxin-NADP reductase/predicted pyridoxine 5'-phosphate oxidase superfamily flavin-nucleotide-binding protein